MLNLLEKNNKVNNFILRKIRNIKNISSFEDISFLNDFFEIIKWFFLDINDINIPKEILEIHKKILNINLSTNTVEMLTNHPTQTTVTWTLLS
jgi:hypothetical protein